MKTLKDVLNKNENLHESILDDPTSTSKDLSKVCENPFKYLASLGPEVWEDVNKIKEEFELFRLAIAKECKIKPGDKATGEKNKIAFDLDSQWGPSIWIKHGPYTRELCQSYRGKNGRYLTLREVGKSYAARHFRDCDVYIPSKKLVDQYVEFKVTMGRGLSVSGGIYDMEVIKEYIK